jgi:hypothetical protein
VTGLSDAEMAALVATIGAAAGTAHTAINAAADAAGATCTVCGEWLDAFDTDLGTHALCDPPPDDGPPPPPTIGDLSGVLIDYEANRPRSRQVHVGPSEIAVPCDRRLAYALAGKAQPPDGRVKWAPLVGTAVHAMLAEALAADNTRLGRERWLIERRVHPDPVIAGSCDAYDVDTDTVIDWKIVGKTSLERYMRGGPGPQYEGQVHIYGRGWQRAGRKPRWVRIVFLPRGSASFDDAYEWTAPYDRRTAADALDRMYRIAELLTELGVADDPTRWQDIPAQPDKQTCRWCPYYRRGGPADGTGCPGDVEAEDRRAARFADGLIEAA